MTLARRLAPVTGRSQPRIAPPLPARSSVREFEAIAAELGIDLYPWQRLSGRYINATGPDKTWLYGEVAVVVARQNGKTELLVPHIVGRLRAGRRIMHTAQNRELPREVFGRVADVMQRDRSFLRSKPRFANGQEEIRTINGGHYRIVAPTRSGARGPSNDDVIIDEVREMDDFDFIAAAKPTLTASRDPQVLYLSNAGEEDSIVLNAIRLRAAEDPRLAYLEWSAAAERAVDDRAGWYEANPSVGHNPAVLPYLENEYVSNRLAGTLAIFETEHLCRWVVTTREQLVDPYAWQLCRAPEPLETPRNAVMAVSLDPQRTRASACIAWQRRDGTVGLRFLYDVPGDPIDTDALGVDLRASAAQYGIRRVAYDPLTDAELAKYFRKPEAMSGQKFANASSQFVNIVAAGRLRWQDADRLTDDLTWTARKSVGDQGAFEAVRATDDRPITAALAAIRAVGLVSGPRPPTPRVM
jgi:hypothetical protein